MRQRETFNPKLALGHYTQPYIPFGICHPPNAYRAKNRVGQKPSFLTHPMMLYHCVTVGCVPTQS